MSKFIERIIMSTAASSKPFVNLSNFKNIPLKGEVSIVDVVERFRLFAIVKERCRTLRAIKCAYACLGGLSDLFFLNNAFFHRTALSHGQVSNMHWVLILD
jgi:hypothetical protein